MTLALDFARAVRAIYPDVRFRTGEDYVRVGDTHVTVSELYPGIAHIYARESIAARRRAGDQGGLPPALRIDCLVSELATACGYLRNLTPRYVCTPAAREALRSLVWCRPESVRYRKRGTKTPKRKITPRPRPIRFDLRAY